ncbi:WD40 repeat-like protein, partial [Ceratobasidium sp. AG-I]
IWDAHTGQMVGEPLQGHTGSVNSVGYSRDGTRIVSGSGDKTIRIWDAHTGQMVGEPLQGHTGSVNSVGFSHDGIHIVSGSEDNTIRIWDAHTSQTVDRPLNNFSVSKRTVNPIAHHSQLASDHHLLFNYASFNDPLFNPHSQWKLNEDGWVFEYPSKLLTWVPPDVRPYLVFPPILVTISALAASLSLDFSNAQLGQDWTN